jgi:ABC-2 type transport system permease protein
VAAVMPPQYFIRIIKNIMIKGTGFSYVWKDTLILLLFTLGAIGISLRKFQTRLQ